MRTLWRSKCHLGSFWQFFANFLKSKKRSSAPSRERIYVMAQLFYQDLKTQPDGTRCKKVIQDFKFTVIMLIMGHNMTVKFMYWKWFWMHECWALRHHLIIYPQEIPISYYESHCLNSLGRYWNDFKSSDYNTVRFLKNFSIVIWTFS